MDNWTKRKHKKRYDNLYARMIFKEMINPKITLEDYNVGKWEGRRMKLFCEKHSFRDGWDRGMYYYKHCFPWVNEFEERVQRNVRGKMKRKYYYGEGIDVRDFLEK